jgi:DNA repair exonuclease SbcCD ATPase subunit
MTVDLVPNREIFEEIYPDESDSEDAESDDEDADDSDLQTAEVKTITKELESLRARMSEATERCGAAAKRLEILDNYGTSLDAEHNSAEVLKEALAVHLEQRDQNWRDREEGFRQKDELTKAIDKIIPKLHKATKESRKQKRKAKKEKAKEVQKQARKRAEKLKEKRRLREERMKFWPKMVYRVVLHLETPSMDTPSSSRRTPACQGSSITRRCFDGLSFCQSGDLLRLV